MADNEEWDCSEEATAVLEKDAKGEECAPNRLHRSAFTGHPPAGLHSPIPLFEVSAGNVNDMLEQIRSRMSDMLGTTVNQKPPTRWELTKMLLGLEDMSNISICHQLFVHTFPYLVVFLAILYALLI